MEINIDKLINAIKIRPALYDKDNPMYYSHKKFKHKLWREICEEVCKNWNTLTQPDKHEFGREVQKRWKSLRTCFTRELGLQRKERLKKETTNEPVKKRKKYEYFNSLSFLLKPEIVDLCTITKEEESDSDNDPLESGNNESVPDEIISNNAHMTTVKVHSIAEDKMDSMYDTHMEDERLPIDEKILDIVKYNRDNENDDDRQFALSLVSMFKQLDSRRKLQARIEILRVLQKMMYDTEKYPPNSNE